jgi:hypothetical protein
VVVGLAGAPGCGGGGASKREPTQRDIALVGAAVADVVYQCQSAAAGFIAGPDRAALKRDVDRLVAVARDVEADARFRFPRRAEPTTLRAQLQQTERSLRADCAPEHAARIADALQ